MSSSSLNVKTTITMLENQGYSFNNLSTIVNQIDSSLGEELLNILQNLAQDKQEASVIINRNSTIVSKLNSELDLQRKQCV